MDKLERFTYWKRIAVDVLRAAGGIDIAEFERIEFKNEDQFYGYFECFRPNGAGIEHVFAGIVGGDEIVQRLLKIYECTNDSTGAYFIVRRPRPAKAERLLELAVKHLEHVRRIAIDFGDDKLANLLKVQPRIEIKREAIADSTQARFDAPEARIYDVSGDWFIGLQPIPSEALMLEEAFYSIACDYKIARYIMWPLYRQSTEIDDPFAPYFELWKHGALPFFGEPGLVTLYFTGEI